MALGTDAMHAYRLYTYDAGGNLIGPALPIAEDNDERAIEHARKLHNGHYAELCDQQRLVHRFTTEH